MKATLRDLLNVGFRCSRALFTFWMVAIVSILVFYSQTTKLYDSNARILVSMGSEAQGSAEYLNGKNLQLAQREQQIYNEQQILESHHVLETTAKWILGDLTPGDTPPAMDWKVDEARRFLTGEQPEPTFLLRALHAFTQPISKLTEKSQSHPEKVEDLARTLSKALTVKTIFNSDALDVSFRYRDPRVAQTVLNLVLKAYLDHHIAVFQGTGESDLLKAQLDRSVNQYQEELGEMSTFMVTHHVYADEQQVNALIEQREKLNQALGEAMADTKAAAARFATLQSSGQTVDRYEHYSTTEIRNKQREELSSKLNDALIEEQSLLNRHPKGSRAFEEEEAKIARLRQLLAQQPQQVVDQTEKRRSKASELVESEIIDATAAQRAGQARVERLRQEQERVNAEINDYAKSMNGFKLIELNLDFAKQESEQMGHAYVDSHLRALTSQNAITNVSVIDWPSWDSRPASPKKSMVAAAAVGLLIMGSIALVLASVGLDNTMGDRKTAELRLGVPVTAALPLIRSAEDGSERPDLLAQDAGREFAHIYLTVRSAGPEGVVILLVSPKGGEGSSLVGYELARFLGRTARAKAAFVDCTANRIVTDSDADKAADTPALLTWPSKSTGTPGTNVDSLAALAGWRQVFSYVVIAGGAVHDAVDLLTIAPLITSTFLVVEAGRTRSAAALRSLELLRNYGFEGTKLILNKRIFFVPNWLMRFV
jgi:uncharacterized protein involved in exopolysaccharide biosynthesis